MLRKQSGCCSKEELEISRRFVFRSDLSGGSALAAQFLDGLDQLGEAEGFGDESVPAGLTGVGGEGFDVLWVHGYSTLNALQSMLVAKALGIPVLLRAESRLTRETSGALKRGVKRLFFFGLKRLVDGVLPIGTLNAAYWRHYLGEDFPMFGVHSRHY